MADQNSRGFRKFMLDPKSSVMTYIADNIPPDHLSHQSHHEGSNGRLQNGPMNSQQPNIQDPNRPQQNQILGQNAQNQSQDGFMRPPLANRPSQSNSQSSSPRPGYAQPVQSSQMPMMTPYIASNISQASQGLNGYVHAQSQLPGSQSTSNISTAQDPLSQQGHQSQLSSVQNGGPSQSAPRLYHQHNTQEMASTAYELESSSRRIWGLRFEHSWEFEGYSEAGHQAVFSKWQAEYEMWADTVLDIQDGQVPTDVANPSKYGNISMHRDADEQDSQSRQDLSGFQGLNGETQHQSPPMHQEQIPPHMLQQMPQHQPGLPPQQMPLQQEMFPPQQIPSQPHFSPSQQMPQQQQMPQLQNLSMGQSMPPAQSMPNSQPSQPMPPGSFPQSGPPPMINDQNRPPQQRPQSPQPPQMAGNQSPPPNMQTGPSMQPGQFNGPPNMQSVPNSFAQNMQQPQNMRPGPTPNMQPGQNRPPQQYMQQPQNMGPGQQGPPRNSMSPGQNMPQGQNMGPRQNPSPRPGPQVAPGLQAGGQMQGSGRQ